MRSPFACLSFDGKAEEAANFYTSLLSTAASMRLVRSQAVTAPSVDRKSGTKTGSVRTR